MENYKEQEDNNGGLALLSRADLLLEGFRRWNYALSKARAAVMVAAVHALLTVPVNQSETVTARSTVDSRYWLRLQFMPSVLSQATADKTSDVFVEVRQAWASIK